MLIELVNTISTIHYTHTTSQRTITCQTQHISVVHCLPLSIHLHTCSHIHNIHAHAHPDLLAIAHQHPPQSGGAAVEDLEGEPEGSCNASGAGSCSPQFLG